MGKVSILVLVLTINLLLTETTAYSLLPWSDERPTLLSELIPDPFRILEQMPFSTLDDEKGALATPAARVDWKETGEGHEISIDVPGLNRDEMKIEVDEFNRVLKVSGERKREEEKKGDHWHRSERCYGKFWRQFRLPQNVDLDKVKARLENGVLTINLPKLTAQQTKPSRMVSIDTTTASSADNQSAKLTSQKQEL